MFMRILFITDAIPYPAISGAPLRTYNLLRHLAKQHEVYLAAFVKTPEQKAGVAHLQEFCQMVKTAEMPVDRALRRPFDALRYLIKGIPPDLRFHHSDELARKIRRLAATVDFDIVQIDHTHMGLYLEALPRELWKRAVWMVHDIDYSRYARLARVETKLARKLRLWLHSRMLQSWEPHFAERFKRCVTVSRADRELLLAANPRLQVDVAPNGVDTQIYKPLPPSTAPALIFVGNMDAIACVNAMVYFCRQIFPLIRRVIPQAEMWIVGINPRPEVKALAGNGIHVTGQVDDVRPYYGRSTVCVVPLRAGGGTRLKILEAMALGRPVVSTTIGCEGLEVTDGVHLLIADSPESFAEKTLHLLQDKSLQESLTWRARQLVTTHYDWEVIAAKLMQVYAKIEENNQGKTFKGKIIALKARHRFSNKLKTEALRGALEKTVFPTDR
jgi:sugar transferase (PEP-CTERM/EpsH1 system associated)